MKVKRIIAVLLAVIIAIAAVPVQARAEEVYTVTLKAGTVGGDVVVYRSDQGIIADSKRSSENCQFYRCDNNGMGFNLSNDYCPASFTAPYGWYFDGWEGNNEYNDNIYPTTTFTAKWREKDTTASQGPIDGIPKTSRGEDFYLNGMKWHVIGEDKNRWLAISSELLSVRGLLTMPWGDAMAYCGDVYDGFSDCEKASLLKMTKTDEYYKYGGLLCDGIYAASSLNETGVFLLSMPEANWYFADNDARVCNGGEYGWWLRSRLQDRSFALTVVPPEGGLHYSSVDYGILFGCRPAFVLNRSSVLFTSAAEGGKSSVAAGKGFGNFQDGGTGAKKLTLLDSDRSGFSADVGGGSSATAVPGGTVEINYSGAGKESNEYVSAMLCDSKDSVIGYASVLSGSDGEDTWSLTLPLDLKDGGTYTLKVFSEQQNGDHLTDYASTPVEIGLTVGSIPGWSPEAPVETVETVEMHRLYNPNSGEHFFTGNVGEKDFLITLGWSYEGVAWYAPESSSVPVYRLYNPNAGDHHYTMNKGERDILIELGWNDEGIGWYSSESETVPLYRLYNPNALQAGAHHFTADTSERDFLIELGWTDEGIGWYGVTPAKSEYVPGDTVILGSYEQDNDLSNGPEPIEWQVIGTRDGHTLLLSKYALDCKKYNETYMDYMEIDWENCTLRSWLNNDFYNTAFSASDRKRIVTAHNENPDSYDLYKQLDSSYGAVGGNATDDNVFLLSFEEVRDYFDGRLYNYEIGAENYNQKLLCRPTAYVKAQGVETYSNSNNIYPADTVGCCWWWLRSPGYAQDFAATVGDNGAITSRIVKYDADGVRPAILID